ncbi:MAG: hypothetical protein IH827_00590 [Myxococcales bacterium]|nr:hypothetical protein [Myxococcales bacterium]
MMFKTAEDVAREYRRRYRRDPDPKVWDLIVEKRWIEDVIDEPAEVDSVFDWIRNIEDLRRQPRAEPREATKELAPDRRAIALAQIRAIEAARDPLVEAFRGDCLRGRLLKPGRIKHWIEKKKDEQGVPARYVKRWERTDGARVKPPPDLAHYGLKTKLEFGNSSSGVYLQYPDGSVQVSADSTLGRLKFLASELCHRHLWPEEEAVGFILSGTAPSPFLGRVTIRRQPRAPRVAIEVDPRVRGDEVLRLYKWARDPEMTKARSLSEVHAELAVFAAERNDGREWNRVLTEWNQTHPRSLYPELRNFIRDCRKAYERITGESLVWRRPRGAAGHRRRSRG